MSAAYGLRVGYVRLAVQTARCAVLLRRRGLRAGLVTCEGRLPVVHAGGRARIGRLALRGFTAPVELGAVEGGELTVGDRVFVNQGASIVASLSIRSGDDVRIGDHVGVYDSDHHPLEQGAPVRRAPVTIGRNAWLARGAIVLPGVTIGEHAVVAAGAVVTDDVPARSLVAGNPARVVRELRADDGWRRP
jgi:acetyltransferase-like isoleucine patch superfamily enzyme